MDWQDAIEPLEAELAELAELVVELELDELELDELELDELEPLEVAPPEPPPPGGSKSVELPSAQLAAKAVQTTSAPIALR